MSKVYVVVRDDNDWSGQSEVLAVYTVDALALGTVDELNDAAAKCGAPERFRALRVDLNSSDRLPGQWLRRDVAVGDVVIEEWGLAEYVPLAALRVHRPDWQPWPTLGGAK